MKKYILSLLLLTSLAAVAYKYVGENGENINPETFQNALGLSFENAVFTDPSGEGFALSASSLSGNGVRVITENGNGIYAYSTEANAVYAESNNSIAIYGISNNGLGIVGSSPTATGIMGTSLSDIGVKGTSNSGIALAGTCRYGKLLSLSNISGEVLSVDNDGVLTTPDISVANLQVTANCSIDAASVSFGDGASVDFNVNAAAFFADSGSAYFSEGSNAIFDAGSVVNLMNGAIFYVRGKVLEVADTLSGAGAVPITRPVCKLTSTGSGQAITLANGTDGQQLKIIHAVDGGSMVLTATTKSGWTTSITFTNVADNVTLQYFTTLGWVVLSSKGATVI